MQGRVVLSQSGSEPALVAGGGVHVARAVRRDAHNRLWGPRPGRVLDVLDARLSRGVVFAREDCPISVDHGFAGVALPPRAEDDLALAEAAAVHVVLMQQGTGNRVRPAELVAKDAAEGLVVDAAHAPEQPEEVAQTVHLSGTNLIGASTHLGRPEAIGLVLVADEVGQFVEVLLQRLLAPRPRLLLRRLLVRLRRRLRLVPVGAGSERP